jgi:hypothetical protein
MSKQFDEFAPSGTSGGKIGVRIGEQGVSRDAADHRQ